MYLRKYERINSKNNEGVTAAKTQWQRISDMVKWPIIENGAIWLMAIS